MAGYVRQSSFVDGDTITAALFNDEYNQLVNAFHNSTGHAHDGTAASGPVIGLIGDAGETSPNNKVLIDTSNNYIEFYVEVSSNPVQQLYIADGAIIPVTDNDIDLGTSSLEFKDLYLDGTAHIDTLDVDANAGIIGNATVGGTLDVTGNTTLTANLTVNGNTTLGNAASDTVTITADVASDIIPSADSTHTLGDSSNYWSHGYIDAITTTGNVAVGGNLTVTGTTTFNGGTITMGDAADDNVVFGADVNSNIIPNTDNTYDLGSSSQEWKDLYVDGVAYLDGINFNGTAITSTAAEINILDGVTATAAEINTLDGITSTVSELNIIDGSTSATSTTLADADRVVVNDNGTMVQVALTDFETYFESALDTLSNVTTVGALNSGSITSGFGSIDNGSSAITTTGTVTYGSLSDGSITITAFVDEDDMSSNSATLVPTQQSVKAYVDTQLTAEDLDLTTDSGTIAIDLDSETLTIGGTSNEIETSATGNTVTIGIPAAAQITTSLGIGGGSTNGVQISQGAISIKNGGTQSYIDFYCESSNAHYARLQAPAHGSFSGNPTITLPATAGTLALTSSNITGSAATLTTARTIGGVSFDGSANINLPGVNTAGNQDTTGNAATATALATARTIGGTSFDGTANISVGLADTATALATARTIHGVSFDGTANIDLTEVVQDTVGAMFSGNTETGISATYEDGDGTIDLVIGSGVITNAMLDGSIANSKLANSSITVTDGSNSTATALGGTITFAGTSNEIDVVESSGTITYGLPSNVTIGNNLTVSGNLTVTGTTTQTGAIISDDNFTGLTNANSANSTDFGFFGKYVESSTTKYAGLFYDASTDNTFRLFADTQTEPAVTVNTGATGYAAANLIVNNLTGTLATAAQPNITSLGTLTALTGGTGDFNWDSNTLVVDSSTNRVGILNASPDVSLDIGSATDAVHVPVGTTAQRPGSPAAGYFRYNTSLSQFEGYTDAWGAIGGGGTNTFTHDVFTGNGSTTAYTLSQSTESENNLIVFIDGVFQEQSAYSIATSSGTTTLTFSAAPANGRKIVVYTVAAGVSGSNLNIDTMTGDGSDTTLTLSIAPVNENNTQVFFDGVYQNKSTYSISGTTLTFSTAPPTGVAVEVMTFTQTDINVPVDGTITSAKLSGDLTTPGTLTSTGVLTANAGVVVDNITIDGTEIDLSSGDLTIDVAGDIILDADGADIIFKDGGTQFGKIGKGGGSDLIIDASIADKDIFLTGTDGSTAITALLLDMSNAGKATFNAGADFASTVQVTDATYSIYSSGASAVIGHIGNTANDLNIYSSTAGHNGLRFHVNGILPTDNSGTIVNNDADLGDPSYTFKDLYLGGNVYLGGNTSNGLDDYEEGTWTVAEKNGQGGTVTTNRANYTKIGRMVFASASVLVGTTTNNNILNFTLPFASTINGYYLGGGNVSYHEFPSAQSDNLRPNIENAAADVHFLYGDNSTPSLAVKCNQVSTKRIDFFVQYQVS